jgi:hypothetical protein
VELSAQFHAPVALLAIKSVHYPLDRRLGGFQSRSRRCGEKEIYLLPCPGIEEMRVLKGDARKEECSGGCGISL